MNTNRTALKVTVLVLGGVGLALGGYWAGTQRGTDVPVAAATQAGKAASDKTDPKTGRKVLYWQDPMVPGQRFDKPGKSPYMDMQLVPVYADEAGTDGGVKVSPTVQQNLGIRYAVVKREDSRDTIEVVGTTQFDESNAEVIQSRVTGYIERLSARAPMQRVKRGQAIATLFVPDWIAPQEEYLALKRSGNETLANAARQRMRAMSVPDGFIAQLDRTGQVQRNLTLTSPVNGVITELTVREGAMVSPGMTVAKVSGLDKVWLLAEVPEALAGAVRPGMSVEANTSNGGGQKVSGKVREILPGVSQSTRTVQARLELDNRDGSLTPGLLMRVRLGSEKPVSRLLVPIEAVISTGRRSVVLVAGENNAIQPVEVTAGRDFGDNTEILNGLTEGQKVVASGQFLIDSEASLRSVLPKLAASAQTPGNAVPAQNPGASVYRAAGKVAEVTDDSIAVAHGPVPELKWPEMTMSFSKPSAHSFHDIKVGQEVEFTFKKWGDDYVLDTVTPKTGGKK
jgi:membrane fusion protein, copper/silver efflux system